MNQLDITMKQFDINMIAWTTAQSKLEDYFRKTPQQVYAKDYATFLQTVLHHVLNSTNNPTNPREYGDINTITLGTNKGYQILSYRELHQSYQRRDSFYYTTIYYSDVIDEDPLMNIYGGNIKDNLNKSELPNYEQVKAYSHLAWYLLASAQTYEMSTPLGVLINRTVF